MDLKNGSTLCGSDKIWENWEVPKKRSCLAPWHWAVSPDKAGVHASQASWGQTTLLWKSSEILFLVLGFSNWTFRWIVTYIKRCLFSTFSEQWLKENLTGHGRLHNPKRMMATGAFWGVALLHICCLESAWKELFFGNTTSILKY